MRDEHPVISHLEARLKHHVVKEADHKCNQYIRVHPRITNKGARCDEPLPERKKKDKNHGTNDKASNYPWRGPRRFQDAGCAGTDQSRHNHRESTHQQKQADKVQIQDKLPNGPTQAVIQVRVTRHQVFPARFDLKVDQHAQQRSHDHRHKNTEHARHPAPLEGQALHDLGTHSESDEDGERDKTITQHTETGRQQISKNNPNDHLNTRVSDTIKHRTSHVVIPFL